MPEASGSNKRLFETQVGAMLGTPAYMSPEQARGQALDERSDVYSLSMMFYELLTLHHPFEREETLEGLIAAILTKPIPYAVMQSGPLQGSVPADLSWYVERGLRKDKDERYQSVEEMIVRLRNRASGDIPVQCPITFTMRATTLMRQSVSRRPFLMSTVFLLGTVATFALAFVGVFKLVT